MAEKKVDLGFVGPRMVHKGDIKIVAQMLRNLEKSDGDVEFSSLGGGGANLQHH